MNEQFVVPSLGNCRIQSPLPLSTSSKEDNFRFVEDSQRILYQATFNNLDQHELFGGESPVSFEAAGPRAMTFFDASKVRAGIVTCGGLCPGINNVIRALVMQMYHNYGVRKIYGFRYGFQGFIPKYRHDITELTPDSVVNIHHQGGSILSSSRGPQDIGEIVDCLDRHTIKILFCIGGDGTLRGAHAIAQEVKARDLKIAVIGVPKTIDNDISYCSKTFGFETAFSKAVEAVQSAHVEAYGAHYGVVVIKLMGRDSGFIAANTSLACPDVNFVLIPEVRFDLHGPEGMMAAMENSFDEKQKRGQHPHSVIVVAEGAGQYLMSNRIEKRDPSGNIRYSDIGLFLKESIQKHFEGKMPVSVRLIEPSYLIRSLPANPHDAIFCYHLADHAVHAGMAGRTDVMIGYWNSHFTHVPLEAVVQQKKRIDPNGDFWRQVLFSTGQPNRMYNEVLEESDAKSLN